jgi:lysophospholipase L1-like esterase
MRRSLFLGILLGLVAVGLWTGASASPSPEGPRYLALGDSLAGSSQARGPHNRGYAEQLLGYEARRVPGVTLLKLGRGGETAARMLRSPRPGPSQLRMAEVALRERPTALVTIDIGANEVERCRRGAGFDYGCVDAGLTSLRTSLPQILRRLRAAAPSSTPIVGIDYYNYFLGKWVRGRDGRVLARRSAPVERRINATLAAIYRHFHVPLADVEDAFATDQLDQYVELSPYGRIPLAVARVCRWTWSCVPDGDDHANSAGYAVIAHAVERVLPDPTGGA